MKKYLFIFVGLLLGLGLTVGAAPAANVLRNVAPETDSTYYFGTASNRWLQGFFDRASTTALTIDGITGSTQCLHVDTTGKVTGTGADCSSASGTVTSVDMSVPLGLAISGNPITGAGTLALSLATGYIIPLTASTTDWTTAFNWGDHSTAGYFPLSLWYATTTHSLISSLPSLSITKSQVSDFGTYEAPLSFTYPLSRSVNTVSILDMATSSLSVDASITSSGTLGSQVGGTASQLSLNMANANVWTGLQTFTTASTTGIHTVEELCFTNGQCMNTPAMEGSGITLYPYNVVTDLSPYEGLRILPISATEVDESCSTGGSTYCAAVIDNYVSTTTLSATGPLVINMIPAGTWTFDVYSYVNNTGGNTYLEFTMIRRTSAGAESDLFQATTTDINATVPTLVTLNSVQSASAFDPTDRLVMRVKGWSDATPAKTVHWLYGGTAHYSHVTTPITIASEAIAFLPADNIFTGANTFNGASTFSGLATLSSASTTLLSLLGKTYDSTNALGSWGKYLSSDANGLPVWLATSTLRLGINQITGNLGVNGGGTGRDTSNWTDGTLLMGSPSGNQATVLATSTGGSLLQIAYTTGRPSWVATSTLNFTKSQITDFGTYENPLTFSYPLTRATDAISLSDMATTSVTCTGSASCDPFTVLGSSPITISATGGSGSGNVATSTAETSGYVPFWTSNSATPATLGATSTLFWDNSATGRLGIGTTSPATVFTISANNPEITLYDNSEGGDREHRITSTNGNLTFERKNPNIFLGGWSGADMFGVGTIDSLSPLGVHGGVAIGGVYSDTNVAPTDGLIVEGNVGIGTTTPNYKLQVTSADAGYIDAVHINDTDTSGTAGATRLRVSHENSSLVINAYSSAAALGNLQNSIGFFADGAAYPSLNKLLIGHTGTDVGDDIQFFTNNSYAAPQMALTQAGYLGVGTTSPNSLVHLWKNAVTPTLTHWPANHTNLLFEGSIEGGGGAPGFAMISAGPSGTAGPYMDLSMASSSLGLIDRWVLGRGGYTDGFYIASSTDQTNPHTNTQLFTINGLTGNVGITNNLTISGISGSTQCLHVDSSGNVTGTGSDCGAGGIPAGNDTNVQFNNGGSFGGSDNLTWLNGPGQLGIGTSSPKSKLHVWNSAAATSTNGHYPAGHTNLILEGNQDNAPGVGLLMLGQGNNSGPYVDLTVSSSTLGFIDRWILGRDDYQQDFFIATSTNGDNPHSDQTRLFRINGSTGFVGINEQNPTARLTVGGTGAFAGQLTLDGGLRITGFNDGSIPFGVNGDGTVGQDSNLFWDNGSKRLGLGTTTPSDVLQIASTANTALTITDTDSGANDKHWKIRNNEGVLDFLKLGDDLTDGPIALTIETNRDVNVNNAPDISRLNVGGGPDTTDMATLLENGGTQLSIFNGDTTNGNFRTLGFWADPGNGATSTALIASTLVASSTDTNSGDLRFYTQNAGLTSEKMQISKEGYVGIGVTSPESRLHMVEDGELQYRADSFSDTSGHSVFLFRRGRGTAASRSSVQSGDEVFEILGYGWDAGSATWKSGAAFSSVITDSDTSQTGLFADLRFATINGGSRVQRMVIQDSGEMGIGDDTPASLLTVGASDAFQVNTTGQVVAGTWMGGAVGGAYGGTGLTTNTPGSLLVGALAGGNAWTAYATTSLGGFLTTSYTTGMPAWVATSTLNLNFGNIAGNLGINGGGTGKNSAQWTDGTLLMGPPSGNSATVLATSTGGSMLSISQTTGRPSWVATSTLFATQHFYPAFTYSTSTAWTGTTTIPLGPAYNAETWDGVKCFTDAGTLNVTFNDGTNLMDMFNASTTVGTVTLATNNAFTASEKRYVDVGTPASSPTKISCTVSKLTQTGL